MRFLSIALSLLITTGLAAQTAKPLQDIYPGVNSSITLPAYAVALKNQLFFVADDGQHGPELWVTDGTQGNTRIFKDINSGAIGSNPTDLYVSGNKLFFSSDNGTNGRELWVTDGTTLGTMMVSNVSASGNGFSHNTNGPSMFAAGNMLFFLANNDTNGTEIWVTDGTSGGTHMLADLNPGPGSTIVYDMKAVSNQLYFITSSPSGRELWKTDGTTPNLLLKASQIASLTPYNGNLIFTASDAANGMELWKTDGTVGNTTLIKDIFPGAAPNSSNPSSLLVANGLVFFNAMGDTAHGIELWRTDGTTSGTMMVSDIAKGSNSSGPHDFAVLNGALYFSATDGNTGYELWKTDGTTATMVKDIFSGTNTITFKPNSSDPRHLTLLKNRLFFSAESGLIGRELWSTDGTAAGTHLVQDIDTGKASSNPGGTRDSADGGFMVNAGNQLFFTAFHPTYGLEVWMVDSATVNGVSFPQSAWDYRLYPNPAHTVLHLETGNAPVQYVELRNMLGQSVREIRNPVSDRINISTADLPAGIYILTAKGENASFIQKVIVE